jgi:low temperature requirement protein LtrA
MGAGLVSLLMSAAIPTAFTSTAALFAGAYVALQVGRNVAQLLLLYRGEPLRPLFQGVAVWSCASGILATCRSSDIVVRSLTDRALRTAV